MRALPIFGDLITGQGGRFGAILRGAAADGGQDYVLIVADQDIGELKDMKWSSDYIKVNGAESKSDGRANTEAMAAAGNMLAMQIRAIEHEGHNDFYIPSAAEMRALSATVPELFSTADWYWTSSQGSRYGAWAQDFENGYSFSLSKDSSGLVRAVRQIPLSHFNA